MSSAFILRRKAINVVIALFVIILLWHVLERSVPTDTVPRPWKSSDTFTSNHVDHAQGTNSFDWAKVEQTYQVKDFMAIPRNPGRSGSPNIQSTKFVEKDKAAKQTQKQRLEAVKGNFTHAWHGYMQRAWMKDEVAPLSGGFHDTFGGWGATLVDSLGTLWIMGMEREFEHAVGSIKQIDFSKSSLNNINVFETTIRYLGGFISAYDLSKGKYNVLKDKAVELGEMLYHAFDTPNRMPITRWDFKAAMSGLKPKASEGALVAELASLTLEFTRLSQLTGDPKYYDAVQRVMDVFEKQQDKTRLPGLWPVLVNAKDQDMTMDSRFTIGGMADSAYEYLPKQHQLLNGGHPSYKKMYEKSLNAMKERIFYRPMTAANEDILLAGQVDTDTDDGKTEAQAQHLACFAGGMVGLGAKLFSSEDDLEVARSLVDGCLWAYESAENGIMPEIIHTIACEEASQDCKWDAKKWHAALVEEHPEEETTNPSEIISKRHLPPGVIKIDDGRYILRPEAIESVFYFYRLTGETMYQERAWEMFKNIVKYTTTDIAHAALADCTIPDPETSQMDKMESFWLAETLKYFYLIFADEGVVSLDDWVFNTEAHPLRCPD